MSDWIVGFIETHGYLGVALLMMAENVFPPIPSELIMPFAGFAAARGDLHAVGVVLAGSVGSLLGTLPWYWAGRRVGRGRLRQWTQRHGRWLAVSSDELSRAEEHFSRHGGLAVMGGRLVPALRSVISAPAGVMQMPLPRFLLWSGLGTALWTAGLTGLGFVLDAHHEKVGHWIEPVSYGVVTAALVAYVWRVATFGKRRAQS
jgi:membrane protein DedA with SNARE-associated domain